MNSDIIDLAKALSTSCMKPISCKVSRWRAYTWSSVSRTSSMTSRSPRTGVGKGFELVAEGGGHCTCGTPSPCTWLLNRLVCLRGFMSLPELCQAGRINACHLPLPEQLTTGNAHEAQVSTAASGS